MTPPRKANHIPHFLLVPALAVASDHCSTTSAFERLNSDAGRKIRFRAASCTDPKQLSSEQPQSERGRYDQHHADSCSAADFVHGVSSLRSAGAVLSCVLFTSERSRGLQKSNDIFGRALTKSSVQAVLRWLRRLCGRSTPPRTSRPSPGKTSGPAPAGYPANSNLPGSSLRPSSPKLRGATERRPF